MPSQKQWQIVQKFFAIDWTTRQSEINFDKIIHFLNVFVFNALDIFVNMLDGSFLFAIIFDFRNAAHSRTVANHHQEFATLSQFKQGFLVGFRRWVAFHKCNVEQASIIFAIFQESEVHHLNQFGNFQKPLAQIQQGKLTTLTRSQTNNSYFWFFHLFLFYKYKIIIAQKWFVMLE